MQPLVQSTEDRPVGPLELRVYPGNDCRGSIYLDDGHTFRYQQGDMMRVRFSCSVSDKGIRVTIGAREGRFKPWWSQIEVVVFGVPGPKAALTVAGKTAPFTYDQASQALHAFVSEKAEGETLELTY
jgi:alpha-glucosidase